MLLRKIQLYKLDWNSSYFQV